MKIAIIGGGGRVGLPLGILLATKDHSVKVIDIDESRVEKINRRIMPFLEPIADKLLAQLKADQLVASSSYEEVKGADVCILITGTPVDNDGIPSANHLITIVKSLLPFLKHTKLLMLRSTVYPGITGEIQNYISTVLPELLVSFCPERIAEGKAIEEIEALPQIIGVESDEAFNLSKSVFQQISPKLIRLNFSEAEISKLFANAYRYLKFGIANEFFKICVENDINWERVWQSLKTDYPRARDLPLPGFAAGPCLVKDTQQLDYFSKKGFILGKSALEINENMPNLIVNHIKSKFELKNMVVGILGMTFKGDVDDFRSSLSFRLKNILEHESKLVLCSDELLQKEYFKDKSTLIEMSDLIIIAAPHSGYRDIVTDKPIIDIWRISGNESLI